MSYKTDLVSWWSLDEESGERADSHGSNPLTDVNTVLYDTGKIGNAADFELGNDEYLSHADNADLSFSGNDPFTIVVWVNMESKAGDGTSNRIVSKSLGAGNIEYRLQFRGDDDAFSFELSNDGSGDGLERIIETTVGDPALATWYFIIAYHDPDGDVIGIQVNNNTADEDAHSGGVYDGTSLFCLGILNAGESQGFDGLMDEVGLWNRLLTADEKTWLYNGGDGRAYSELSMSQLIAGVLSFTGTTQTTTIWKRLQSGALVLSGGLTQLRRIQQYLVTGTLAFSGALVWKWKLALSGLLSFSGGLASKLLKFIEAIVSLALSPISVVRMWLSPQSEPIQLDISPKGFLDIGEE